MMGSFKNTHLLSQETKRSDLILPFEFAMVHFEKIQPQPTFRWSEGVWTNARKRQSHSPTTWHQEASVDPPSRAFSEDKCEQDWSPYTFHKIICGDPKSLATSRVEPPKKKKTLCISAYFTWLNLPLSSCPCRWLKAPVDQHQRFLKPDNTLGGRTHPKLTITFF